MTAVNTLKTGFANSFRSGAIWLFLIAIILTILFALSIGGMLLLQKAMWGLMISFISSIAFFLFTGAVLNKKGGLKKIGRKK